MKKRADIAEEKSANPQVGVLTLEEKSTQPEKKLNDMRGKLASQKSFFEQQLGVLAIPRFQPSGPSLNSKQRS